MVAAPVDAAPAAACPGLGEPHPACEDCVYLDYNATTPIFPEVAEAMRPYLSAFGNPSSGHVSELRWAGLFAVASPCMLWHHRSPLHSIWIYQGRLGSSAARQR